MLSLEFGQLKHGKYMVICLYAFHNKKKKILSKMLASVFNGFEMNLCFLAFAAQLLTMNLREKVAFILTGLPGGTDRK